MDNSKINKLCDMSKKSDYDTLSEQLRIVKTILERLDDMSDLSDIEAQFKAANQEKLVLQFDTFKRMLADCVDVRVNVETNKDAYDSVIGLIYTKQISKALAAKLEVMNIKSLKDFSNMTFEEAKNARNKNRQSNQRVLGEKAMIELFELLIEHNLGFKDKTPDDLIQILKGYKEFAL